MDLAPRLLGVETQTRYLHTAPFHEDSEKISEKIIRLAADGEKRGRSQVIFEIFGSLGC